ncbi:hypothetical protein PV396_34155 [Streptomyces sp. ME02-8801-2C]|uniref:hypothetical protein n=1 Tax=Streptomyces sp. ME02-8801-2C TaxID=3028680 RepID=UPI0029AC31E5|nr:hypothetical protein [Streptomyces sp. ME02-8801-2C]MDX3456937.1 hypothetical protein [Streptomyces sp. ME02-8801-2C]
MARTFKYRLSGPFGGLAADLTGESRSLGTSEKPLLQIYRNVWLNPPAGINWRDSAWLSFGLSVHALELSATHPNGLIVEVTTLTFPLAHFRSELAALAMDGWIREEFDLPDRGLYAASRVGAGGYTFHWGEHSDPFSDEE